MTIKVIAEVDLVFLLTQTPPSGIYHLSLHDALPICMLWQAPRSKMSFDPYSAPQHGHRFSCFFRSSTRSEEHTSELQSLRHLVCRLLLEKKNAKVDLVHQQTQNQRYGSSHIGATAKA